MTPRFRATLCFVLLPLASCTVGPNYRRPAMPIPQSYTGAATQPATRPVVQSWWQLFGDPTLTSLEEEAIARNYDLQAAMARVEQARATAGIARAGFFPTAALNPTWSRSARGEGGTAVVTGSGGTLTTGSGTAGGTGTGSTGGVVLSGGGGGTRYANSVSVPLDLSYEVDLWGRVRRQYEAATAQTQASINDFGFVRLTLTADVATNYFNLRSLDAQNEIATRNIETYKRQLDFLEKQGKAGFAAPLDVIQVRTLVSSTEATRFDLQRQRRLSQNAIAVLLGRPPSELSLPSRPLTATLPDIPAGLPADLLRQRPDVAQAEQSLIATNAQIGEAIAEFLPTLSLGATAGWRSDTVKGAFDFANRFFSIGPAVSVPIFDASLGPNLKLAQAQYAEQLAVYRTTLLGAFRDVEDALTEIDLRAHQAEAQDRAVADAREYVRLAEIQNRQGILTPLQVLDADRTLLQNELTAAQILNARMASTVLLIRAIGGGWSPDLPPSFMPTTQPAVQQLAD